jgi:DNA-binding transcriptional LysR family regulator
MQWSDRIGRRLKPRDLHVFMAVAEHGNMANAADRLAISRPVVSKAISQLEHTLGVPLFDRSPQGVEPTLYGRALLKHGVAIFDELRQSVKEIEFLVDPTSGELRLGCADFMAGIVGVAIDRMSRRYSRIVFEVVSTGWRQELRARNIELFVAVPEEPFNNEDFDTEILYNDPIVVVADPRHSLTRRRSLQLAELVHEAWALPPANSTSGDYIRNAFQTNGLALPARIVSTYSHVLRHHLVATAGFITVLPKATIEVLAKGLSIKALPVQLPPTSRTAAIVVLKRRTLSPIAQLFIETLRAVAKPWTKAKEGAP